MNDDFGIFAEELRKNGIELFAAISAVSRHGLVEFLGKLLPIALEEREKRRSAAAASAAEDEARIPTLQPHMSQLPRFHPTTIGHKLLPIYNIRLNKIIFKIGVNHPACPERGVTASKGPSSHLFFSSSKKRLQS